MNPEKDVETLVGARRHATIGTVRAAHVVLSGCDQAPLRGQQPKSLRLCRRIVTFYAADAILFLAETRAISLIVMGTHGRRGFDRLMMGSVTERVLRHASCPVLAARPAAPGSNYPGAPDEPVPIRRILCCVDFSAHSRRALEYALSAADTYSADVTVLHVLDPVSQSADVAQETDAAMANLAKLLPPAWRHPSPAFQRGSTRTPRCQKPAPAPPLLRSSQRPLVCDRELPHPVHLGSGVKTRFHG